MEEQYGLRSQVMTVYERAAAAVLPEDRFEMYNIYIKKAAEMFGVPKTREIYEKAIEELDDDHSRQMCLKFAELETKLGEIDRARAIYSHCSQICDPRVTAEFWETWTNFEVAHGNEDTLREMLRIKRSVQATYNTQVNMMSAQMLAAATSSSGTVSDLAPGAKDGMRMLEAKAAELSSADRIREILKSSENTRFVRGETQTSKSSKVTNPDEIDIDDACHEEDEEEDDDMSNNDKNQNEENDNEDMPIEQKPIPSEVFGSLGKVGTR